MSEKYKRKNNSSENLLEDVLDSIVNILGILIITLFKKILTVIKKQFSKNKEKIIIQHSQTIVTETRQQFGEQCRTMKGEIVKSRGEKRIADFLYKQGIKYEYEKALTRKNGKIQHPDFYLTDYNVWIEYFGMLGNSEYNRNISLKKKTFEELNLQWIELYPNNIKNAGWIIKKRFEEVTGLDFPKTQPIPYYK